MKRFIPVALMLAMASPLTINQKTGQINKIIPVSSRRSVGSGSQVLRVLNMEDYIYEQDIDEGYEAEDLVVQFEEYARTLGYDNVSVVYDTTDTNETLYSELQTGKAFYDVICPSDYMCQKLGSDNLLYKLSEEDKAMVPNYFGDDSVASERIKGTLDAIEFHNNKLDTDEVLGDYAVGYMWGTLGMLFNPTYKTYEKRGFEAEEVIADMQSWDSLWDSKYKNTFSIKDSMRDTYAVGILKTFEEELEEVQAKYEEDDDYEAYAASMEEIFNRCDQESADSVKKNLDSLKRNSFGLEVDSGKQDICTGKIGLNIAWSGDAVYSMTQAEDPEQVSEPFELCYSIPEIGSNVWFDAWVIPNTKRSDAQLELALLFLNFISDPENVAQNMDYIGYTSFIGGDAVLELVRDWYDYRTDYLTVTDEEENEYPVMYNDGTEDVELDYSDFLSTRADNEELFYYVEEEKVPFTDPNSEEENPEQLHYNDLNAMLEDLEEVDLTYFFDGTLDEYEDADMIFYSDCYLPYENEDGTQNISVGREFFCQYPSLETINRCAVMRDYGENNKIIMKMWEDFKSDALPGWAIALFIVEASLIVGGIGFYFISKKLKLDIRRKRREENK